jgi:hypothetical protein
MEGQFSGRLPEFREHVTLLRVKKLKNKLSYTRKLSKRRSV